MVRELAGNPDQNAMPDYRLDTAIDRAMQWLSVKLKFERRTDEQSLVLVQDQRYYRLPPDFGWIVWVEWNQNKLTPDSVYRFDRDGVNYRHAVSGRPQQYAVQVRTLILLPPPDAGAITTDPALHYRAVFAARPMSAGGDAHLSEMDTNLLGYVATLEALAIRPSDENTVRIQFCEKRIEDLLPDALQRAVNPLQEYFPGWRPYSSRLGGAR